MNKLWRWYMYRKTWTLASRIFTIQFGDAISFAVHAVYEQGCRVSPVYALRSYMLRHVWRRKKEKTKRMLYSPEVRLKCKIRKPDQHLVNMLLVHAGAESQSQTLYVRKAHSNKIHFHMVEEGRKEIFFYWHISPGSRILVMTVCDH